ncbi:MAG: flagellar hook-basal body protein, partial [Anaerocolumna sp.]|nr:flagellar hook-basal body protein [Anaerocolumna sp.]
PETTKSTMITGNLNTDDGTDGIETQIKMYDSLGNLYTCNIYIVYDGTEWTTYNNKYTTANPPTFSNTPITLTDTSGNTYTTGSTFVSSVLEFDASGNLDTSGGSATAIADVPYIDLAAATPPIKATIGDSATGITVDFSSITQYASKTDVDPKTLDGKAAGKMSGYDVGADGRITAYYDNGDRRLLGQIVVAQFDNPAGLEKVGDNLYNATANSGDFDNIGTVGNFQAGVLEMSNVDLSKEFTEMIITQRGFQANSRIILFQFQMRCFRSLLILNDNR